MWFLRAKKGNYQILVCEIGQEQKKVPHFMCNQNLVLKNHMGTLAMQGKRQSGNLSHDSFLVPTTEVHA